MNKSNSVVIHTLSVDGDRIVEISIGNYQLSIDEGADKHLVENLIEGHCNLNMPAENYAIFCDHHLNQITKRNNPTLFDIVYKIFVDEVDLSKERFKIGSSTQQFKALADRDTMELILSIKNDRCLESLYRDPEFINCSENNFKN